MDSGNDTPVIDPAQTFETVTDRISAIVLRRPVSWSWLTGLGMASALVGLLGYAVAWLLIAGTGIWGINVPVGWGFDILNFVWWVGIGHAGSLLSAVLLLMRQPWRNSISRFAESMTLLAIACAGLFPLLHMGRPWYFYWLMPHPSTIGVWPQFRSALIWDLFAFLIYFLVIILFWYVGLIPDLATLRDRARQRWKGTIYAALALGWRGEAEQWYLHERAYRLLAALAAGLVLVVQSITALDFATSVLPGWHATILPLHFIAGALHSGTAMILVLAIPLRYLYDLKQYITEHHLQQLGRLLLATSFLVGYGYWMILFGHWYQGQRLGWPPEAFSWRGSITTLGGLMLLGNLVLPQLLWLGWVRSQRVLLWLLGLVVLAAMWVDRYVVIVGTLQRDFLASAWGNYTPTLWDWALFLGTFGLFFTLFLLLERVLPLISIFEVRQLVPEADPSRDREVPPCR